MAGPIWAEGGLLDGICGSCRWRVENDVGSSRLTDTS